MMAPVPARISLLDRWRHWTTTILPGNTLLLLHYVLRSLPIDLCSAIGFSLGARFGPKNAVRDARVRHNLVVLRPDIDTPEEFEAAVRRFWGNAGRSWAEFSVLRRLWRSDRMSVVGMEHLQAAKATGRPRIALFVHLGNWELVGPKLLELGEDCRQIAQPLMNRYRNRIVTAVRRPYANKIIQPGNRVGREIIRCLRDAGMLSIAADEYVRGELFAPSFGNPVRLDGNLGRVVRLARLTDAIVVPYYCVRSTGAHFQMHVLPSVDLDFARADFLREGAQRLNDLITPIIVRHLDQWMMLDNFSVSTTPTPG
jgi:KDO2-lipid IV(A) lauroyltransferase